MALGKSKLSALVLSAIIAVVYAAVTAAVDILLPYLLTGDIHRIVEHPERLAGAGAILTLAAFILLLLALLIGIGAYALYRFFGEAYYGRRGALRWALFGAFLALLTSLPAIWLPARLSLLKNFWDFLSVFLAFFLARRLVPLIRPIA